MELVRVTRLSESEYRTEDIADVRFVPLVGEEGWSPDAELPPSLRRGRPRRAPDGGLPEIAAASAEAFPSIENADLGPLLVRIGNARIVLIGEATHGTSEFYSMRERISRALITEKGNIIAIEGDWPDAARIDQMSIRRPRASPARDTVA